jgi:hypothetical protein
MIRIFTLITLLFLTSGKIVGQSGVLGYISPGPHFINQDELNGALPGLGLSRVNPSMFAFGLGGSSISGRFVFGADATLFMVDTLSGLARSGSLNYIFGTIHAGYIIANIDRRFLLFPAAAAGGGIGRLVNKPAGQNRKQYNSGGAVADFSLRAIYLPPLQGEDRYSLLLGIQGGYQLAFPSDPWSLKDVGQSGNSIPVAPKGPYFRILLGFGLWNNGRN